MSTIAERLKKARIAAGYQTAKEFADTHKIPQPTYALHEKGGRGLSRGDTLQKYASLLGVRESWLQFGQGPMKEPSVDVAAGARDQQKVATRNLTGLGSSTGTRAGGGYDLLTNSVFVIGSVQAGAWMEAYQLPEQEWTEMLLPADKRFPGIQRFALRNEGQSMNKICRPGGHWIFVRYIDLTGQGPSPGQYVIVERRRNDGLVEATAKRFELDREGRPILCPESDDPAFQPLHLNGGDDVEEITVIGRVVDIVNRV